MASSQQGAPFDGPQVRSLLAELHAAESRFHGWAADIEVNWGLTDAALDLLVDLVAPGDRTLETGVGYSTVVFAARGARHTVVSPFAFEHERVVRWCSERDVDTSSVTFIAEPSQVALPALDADPLDLLLIDGDHAFPTPFIDFYYGAQRLRPGGMLMLDDTHIRSCAVLDGFLRADTPRWRLHTSLRTTNVYERLDGALLPAEGWAAQPWGATPVRSAAPMSALQRVRARLRLRSRLRRGGRGDTS